MRWSDAPGYADWPAKEGEVMTTDPDYPNPILKPEQPAPKKARKASVRKPKSHKKTAMLFAVAIVLAVANLLLLVKLGYQLR